MHIREARSGTHQQRREDKTVTQTTKVVVKGGGSNLYEIAESSGWYYARKVNVGIIDSRTDIGKAQTFDQALSIIQSHSGKGIERVG